MDIFEGIHYEIDPETGCFNWLRSSNNRGYGRINRNKKVLLAHRYFYEQVKGKIPDGMTLDHLCKNTRCINPDHLEPVTHAENCRRGIKSKLTPNLIETFKSLFGEGLSMREIGRRHGFSHTAVRMAIRGLSWA